MNKVGAKITAYCNIWTFFLTLGFAIFGFSQSETTVVENQYGADQGDGYYLNPILKGNYADPTILKDGDNYYMTHSSFYNLPGLLIWHSKDLVNWQPIGHALLDFVGSVWAPDLIRHGDKYYIYFPANGTNWVVYSENIKGPWSAPIDLKVGKIDPGHVVGPDGQRYLHLSAGNMVRLSDDGLRVTSEMREVYEGWPYSKDWIVECFCLESPKFTLHGGYYYMTVAQGGTAGPPTSHMAASARSKSPQGPWENSPYNPIIRNSENDSKWMSTGHGTLVEGPDSKWFIVYHGFENGNRTIGRQTLLLPIEWTDDGWFKVPGSVTDNQPIKIPKGEKVPHGQILSDSFEEVRLDSRWNIIKNENPERFRVSDGELTIRGKGESPANSLPLTIMPANNSYEVSTHLSVDENTSAGLLIYFSSNYYAGVSYENNTIYRLSGNGKIFPFAEDVDAESVFLKLKYEEHVLTYYYSLDGKSWRRLDFAVEMSGFHGNTLSDWGYLRPAIYAAGEGIAKFKSFTYGGL